MFLLLQGGKRLYFLMGSGWLLGPTVGSPQGFIHNANAYLCPYLITSGSSKFGRFIKLKKIHLHIIIWSSFLNFFSFSGWMFVNNGYWYDDTTLVVRCIAWTFEIILYYILYYFKNKQKQLLLFLLFVRAIFRNTGIAYSGEFILTFYLLFLPLKNQWR